MSRHRRQVALAAAVVMVALFAGVAASQGVDPDLAKSRMFRTITELPDISALDDIFSSIISSPGEIFAFLQAPRLHLAQAGVIFNPDGFELEGVFLAEENDPPYYGVSLPAQDYGYERVGIAFRSRSMYVLLFEAVAPRFSPLGSPGELPVVTAENADFVRVTDSIPNDLIAGISEWVRELDANSVPGSPIREELLATPRGFLLTRGMDIPQELYLIVALDTSQAEGRFYEFGGESTPVVAVDPASAGSAPFDEGFALIDLDAGVVFVLFGAI